MNDEIKEAAENYIKNTKIDFEFMLMGEAVEVPELFKKWCIEGIKHGYVQGANYATEKCQEEIKRLNVMIMKMADYIHDEGEEGSLCDEAYRLMSK